ncbi:metal-sensing transcriptional repressor [Angelakisella massiliensis]|uniref:metal-sensing transcriptional repressor n=1 Tax=Angelakisella massiliensis TaxID=1871018 RepID=UPI0008F913BA|nr:metal-sensing transcriptional repressor [Angelakisella massiliensis]
MKADHEKVSRLLKTARGQLDGVLRMIDEDQYCIDIANQILAAEAILRKANREVVRAHMESCVAQAMESGDEQAKQQKLDEILRLLEKMER